jgi:hypothetical protein
MVELLGRFAMLDAVLAVADRRVDALTAEIVRLRGRTRSCVDGWGRAT